MYKSILAISEGGPDATMSFGLAARIASMFGGTVDAVHFSESRAHDVDIAAQAMPFLKALSDGRLKARAAESERAFRELIAPIAGATFTGGEDVTRDQLVTLGRFASILLIGRPGADADNIAPATVKAAIYDCARPVVIAPPDSAPNADKKPISSVVVAGEKPDDIGTSLLLRNLGRRGVAATMETMDPGAVSGRARGRALLEYAREKKADLLVMGAYGHGGLTNFLGLGGATAKVISSCPVPLLLAH